MSTSGDDHGGRRKKGASPSGDRAAQARAERLRAQLRENLKRRKEQARRRKGAAGPVPGDAQE